MVKKLTRVIENSEFNFNLIRSIKVFLLFDVICCTNSFILPNLFVNNNNMPTIKSRESNSVWDWQKGDNNINNYRFRRYNSQFNADEDIAVVDPVDDNKAFIFYDPSRLNIAPLPIPKSSCEKACFITNQYNPVCGTDNVTYSSRDRLLCAKKCGKNIEINHIGKCYRRAPVV